MKATTLLLLLAACCFLLPSCAHFRDGQSVWAEGLWIIPWLTGLGSVFFFYLAYRSSKSNSEIRTWAYYKDNTGNVPIWGHGFFVFFVGLLIATIAIIVIQTGEK